MAIQDVSSRSINELIDLEGRVALVTGGGRGIGLAIGARLAEAGAHVVLADQDLARAEAAAESIKKTRGTLTGAHLDVTSTTTIETCIENTVQKFGSLDILVNNAGLLPATPEIAEMDEDLWLLTYNVNVHGVMRCSRAAARHLIASRFGGVICNVASTSAYSIPNPGLAPYATSKHAVAGLTKCLAVELGPKNVRAVSVSPTMVETPGIQELRALTASRGKPLGGTNAFSGLPLGRAAQPDDVARVVLFLVSDLAILVTGSTVAVDAGALV